MGKIDTSKLLFFIFLLAVFLNQTTFGQKTWTGSTGTDWQGVNNWSPAGIPTNTDVVIIPAAPANQPNIFASNEVDALSINIENGATITFGNAQSALKIHGGNIFVTASNPFVGDGALHFSGVGNVIERQGGGFVTISKIGVSNNGSVEFVNGTSAYLSGTSTPDETSIFMSANSRISVNGGSTEEMIIHAKGGLKFEGSGTVALGGIDVNNPIPITWVGNGETFHIQEVTALDFGEITFFGNVQIGDNSGAQNVDINPVDANNPSQVNVLKMTGNLTNKTDGGTDVIFNFSPKIYGAVCFDNSNGVMHQIEGNPLKLSHLKNTTLSITDYSLDIATDVYLDGSATGFTTVLYAPSGAGTHISAGSKLEIVPAIGQNDVSFEKIMGDGMLNFGTEIDMGSHLNIKTDVSFATVNMHENSLYLSGKTLKFHANLNHLAITNSAIQFYGADFQTVITDAITPIFFPPLEFAKLSNKITFKAFNNPYQKINAKNSAGISITFVEADIEGNSVGATNKMYVDSGVIFEAYGGGVLDKTAHNALIYGEGAVTLNGIGIESDAFKFLTISHFATAYTSVDDGSYQLDGTDTNQYLLTNTSASQLPESQNELKFTSTSLGTKMTFISSFSTTGLAPDFGFRVEGTALGALLNLRNDTDDVEVFHTASVDFGATFQSQTIRKDFEIQNTGNQSLTLTTIQINGLHAADFGLDATKVYTTIPVGGSAFFTVTFTPSSLGFKTAFISVSSHAINHPEFQFRLTGTGTAVNLIVTNPNDNLDGSGKATELNTLRWAIEQAMLLGGYQEVTFNLPNPSTLFLSATLPIDTPNITLNAGGNTIILDGSAFVSTSCGLELNEPTKVYGLTLQGFGTGICVNADDCFITGNTIQQNGTGIYADGVSYPSILQNTVQNHTQKGIYLTHSYGIVIGGTNPNLGNLLKNNEYGIYIESGEEFLIAYNTIEKNTKSGIYISDMYPYNDWIYRNQITGHQEYGIYMENYANGGGERTEEEELIYPYYLIESNFISANQLDGIRIRSSASIRIGNNEITGNQGHGIYFQDVSLSSGFPPFPPLPPFLPEERTEAEFIRGFEVEYNRITHNKLDGVHLVHSSEYGFGYNQVAYNRHGFSLVQSDYLSIGERLFLDPQARAEATQAVDGGNDIHHNLGYGILHSSGYHNSFIKNAIFCNIQGGISTNLSESTAIPIVQEHNNCAGVYGTTQPYAQIHVYYVDNCQANQGYQFITAVQANDTGNWVLPSSIVGNLSAGTKLAFTATDDYNGIGTSSFVVKEYTQVAQIQQIEATSRQTCTQAYYEITFRILGGSNGDYEIDYDNDGTFDETITFVGGEYTARYNGQRIDNPNIRLAKTTGCTSGGFRYTLNTELQPKAQIVIQKIAFEEPTRCANPDGNMIITLRNYLPDYYYNIDLEADNTIDFTTVKITRGGKLIVSGLAPQQRITKVRVIEIGTECVATEAGFLQLMTVPDYPQVDVQVEVNISEISPNYPVTLTIQNPEPNTLYALAKTHDFIDKTEFGRQNDGSYRLTLTSVSETVNFQVIGTRTQTGCEGKLRNTPQVTVYPTVRPEELDILRLLYNRTGGMNWTTQWKFTGNPEDLPGVEVFAGHILKINVEGFGLVDKIPFEIIQLPKLQEFNVNHNQLTFESIEGLTGRHFQFFYQNQAFINEYVEIEIMEGENLFMSVVTEGNFNTYEWYKNGQLLTDYQEDTILISEAKLTDEAIYHALVKNTQAPDLVLQRRDIKVTVFPKPTPLDLSFLKLFYEATGGDTHWKTKWNFENLEVFRWHGITMKGDKIIEISLPDNRLTGFIPAQIFTKTGIFSDLRRINLANNQLAGTIPETLSDLTQLTHLDLSNNQYTGNIPLVIGLIPNLQSLALSHNTFRGFHTNFELNKLSIKYLHLNNNQLSVLPESLGTLENLQVLSLSTNQLWALPASFENLKNLNSLSLSQNKLQEIPAYFTKFVQLKNLYLIDNQLSNLPKGFDKLELNVLAVYNNFLTHDDLEGLVQNFKNRTNAQIDYAPQAKIGEVKELVIKAGANLSYHFPITGTANRYQWYKDGLPIQGAHGNRKDLSIRQATNQDAGIYEVFIANDINEDLVLVSRRIRVAVECGQRIETQIQAQGQTQLCQNESPNVVLTATNIPPNHQLHWLRNGIKIHNAEGIAWTATQAGIYGLLLTDQNGCSAEALNRIEITENYADGIQLVYEDDVLSLKVNYDNISTYQWYRNGEKINVNTAAFIPTRDGDYYLEVISEVGCLGYSETVRITATGLEHIDNQIDFKLFPNPTESLIRIQANKIGHGTAQILILDVSGKVVLDTHFQTQGSFEKQLNLSQLPTGVYMLKLVGESQTYLRKIIRK